MKLKHAVFAAAFQVRCDEASALCAQPGAEATHCAGITKRCLQGVEGPPPDADGGTCQ